MDEEEIRGILVEVGVIVRGHFVYTSGKHGAIYINKDALYPHIIPTTQLCHQIALLFVDDGVEAVIGPAMGGVILATRVAEQLIQLTREEPLGLYADKDGKDDFVIRRGYDKLVAGKRVLVVEDVLTTGNSAKKVVAAVRQAGGLVVGLAALWNRGGITAESVGVPNLVALVSRQLEAWDAEECELCARGIPVNVDVGKGREFLAQHPPL